MGLAPSQGAAPHVARPKTGDGTTPAGPQFGAVATGTGQGGVSSIDASTEALLESVADGVVIVDGSGVIRAVNRHAETMFGYDRADLIGRPVEDLRKDGSEFPVDISLSVLETGQARFVYASVRDITYSRLAAIVASSTDAIVGTLLDGTITSWNAGAEHLYGYSDVEMIGHDTSAITPADLLGELPAAVQRLGRGELVAHFDSQRTCRDRSVVDVSITVSPLRNRSGRVIGASTSAHDVTSNKRIEEALARRGDELGRANLDLSAALVRAEDSEAGHRALLDQMPDTATFLYDREHRVSAVSGSSFMPGNVDLSGLAGKTVEEVYDQTGAASE
jgi:PAS domain S-box-containing protein